MYALERRSSMMMWKNWVNAVIGLWFIVAPWALGFSDKTAAVWTSVIFGLVQLIASAWAATEKNHTGWKSWQNWVSLIMGVWFIIQPFALSLNSGEKWSSVILGLITVLLNLWSMSDAADHGWAGFGSTKKKSTT
jgi:hypothetical protein